MCYGEEKVTINRPPLVVAFGLPTACEEPTCSACTSYLRGLRHPRPVVVLFELYPRRTNLPTFLKPIPYRTFIDILKRLTHSATSCSSPHLSRKINNPERAPSIRPFRVATVRFPIHECEQFITTERYSYS
ncbi:hypothetical protein TNCV_1040881 [Trichonephila clavipes]|nr:hypothetical protein TNCV_1040881 [Trichonephila clavipes]